MEHLLLLVVVQWTRVPLALRTPGVEVDNGVTVLEEPTVVTRLVRPVPTNVSSALPAITALDLPSLLIQLSPLLHLRATTLH